MKRALVLLLFAVTAPVALAQDIAGMDRSVKPGDDFFRFANGAWLDKTQIPADRAAYGVFSMLDEEANRRTADLVREAASAPAGSEARKVGDYYTAYMNEAAIERRGIAAVQPHLRAIAAIRDKDELATYLGSELRADVDALNNTNFHTTRLFGLWVSPGFADPDHYVGYLLQGGLGLPDRDNYLQTDARSVELQSKYIAHIAAILQLAHIRDAESRAVAIYDLERRIAQTHATRTESVDVNKANNPWTMREFATRAPGMNWDRYFAAARLAGQPMLVVWHPGAVTGESRLVASEPLAVWKDYLSFRILDRYARLLPRAFSKEAFRFYGTTLTGTTEDRARWKRAVDATNFSLGDAVGKLYARRYFPPASKAAAQEMVKNIIAAFDRRIDHLDWMSAPTKTKAKAKLKTLYVGIGYPETFRDYSGLKVTTNDPRLNIERSELFDYETALAKLGKDVDRGEWAMTPQTVNAVNLPLQNALNFPAAILNPPFFDAKADPVLNYGAIGAVIGHEISHSFDDQGSQFDERGKLINWWTPEDFAHFTAAGDQLAKQFDQYEPLPGAHVNGRLTLSENLADLAGLLASYDGYRAANGGKPAAEAHGLTGDQRFFVAFAQAWRNKARPEALRVSLMTNGHAPAQYRAATVRNIDAWYDAFEVAPGERLYLAPADRVRAW